jgi:hypothetical protein
MVRCNVSVSSIYSVAVDRGFEELIDLHSKENNEHRLKMLSFHFLNTVYHTYVLI